MTASRFNTLLSLAILGSAMLSGPVIAAAPPLAGTWQLTQYQQEAIETKAITAPFGDHPTGYIQYSPGGHVVVCLTSGDIPKPAAAAYTDAERVVFFKHFIGLYAGTYTVEGNKVVHHILTAWRPEWINGDQERFYELDGESLTIRTAPIKSTATGQSIISILTFKRVE